MSDFIIYINNILITFKSIFIEIISYILHKNLNYENKINENDFNENELQITIYDDIV